MNGKSRAGRTKDAHHRAPVGRDWGRHQEAYDLHQATHNTRRRLLSPDHPATLASAHNLTTELSNLERERSTTDA